MKCLDHSSKIDSAFAEHFHTNINIHKGNPRSRIRVQPYRCEGRTANPCVCPIHTYGFYGETFVKINFTYFRGKQ